MAESQYSPAARRTISRHVRKHKKQGMPQDQAVAAAMSEARRKGKKVPSRKGAKKATKRTTRKGRKATSRKTRRSSPKKKGAARKGGARGARK